MDAKNKMNFINSLGANANCTSCGAAVQSGEEFCQNCRKSAEAIAGNCSSCGESIQAGDAFCQKCGTPVISTPPKIIAEEKPSITSPVIVYAEPRVIFAEGLPEWSLEPPMIPVRRKFKK